MRLTWEDSSFFPHEHSQNNLTALKSAAEALKQGDSAAALDDYLYLVDNNWYAYDWSRETFTYFTDYVLNRRGLYRRACPHRSGHRNPDGNAE